MSALWLPPDLRDLQNIWNLLQHQMFREQTISFPTERRGGKMSRLVRGIRYCKRCDDSYDPSRPSSRGDRKGTGRTYIDGHCRHCSLALQHGASDLSKLSDDEKKSVIQI